MTEASLIRARKLAEFAARFAQADLVHKEAEALTTRAKALDLAIEREAAEDGIEFEEIMREAIKLDGDR